MNELPPCRWRESRGDGTLSCHSDKFIAPPNKVAPDFCRTCYYCDHDPATVPPRPPSSVSAKEVAIAIANLYTPEIEEFGSLAAEVLRAYAKRHDYKVIIAATTLDT